jgi:hypothetical protein
LFLLLFSCSSEEGSSISEEGSFIASYKDNHLTLEELDEVLLNKPSSVDSTIFVNKYIDKWLQKKVVLDKAKSYIDENDKELQSRVNAYKETEIIIRYRDEKIFSKKNKLYSFTDDDFVFLFFIKDYQIKGGESPLPFVFSNIREILRNKNKQKFLNEIEDKLYNEALSSEHIKIYK